MQIENLNTNEKYQKGVNILKNSPLRVTQQRLTLLAYLTDFSEEYITVTNVNRYMHTVYPTASSNTTYNNINEFVKLGILEERNDDGQLSVKYQCDFNQIHHGHFFCTRCHRVIKINGDKELNKVLGMDNFQFQTVNLEIFGLCDQCVQKNAK
ncbi:Fur family transcriptional regulator [Convivina intestini]|uniref:Fur family zinc uptake transcriptional regulator n=1 Tax=Convivina intestini TaxID=1505726 RepID=A0A2U1D677_9LACO|nr:transcriptional repressor [Convivina intestini]PVY83186.1 Fur family zinc uptake transcriptional regulator [Convivina intestini]CAH1856137.1 Zinc-specific metallo-regulatory protein [Convivina intestini]SDB96219.1 Fur family transcriptional regulator, zinc uptake regulator [Leuconostocaceae bacterium R-53105]